METKRNNPLNILYRIINSIHGGHFMLNFLDEVGSLVHTFCNLNELGNVVLMNESYITDFSI